MCRLQNTKLSRRSRDELCTSPLSFYSHLTCHRPLSQRHVDMTNMTCLHWIHELTANMVQHQHKVYSRLNKKNICPTRSATVEIPMFSRNIPLYSAKFQLILSFCPCLLDKCSCRLSEQETFKGVGNPNLSFINCCLKKTNKLLISLS